MKRNSEFSSEAGILGAALLALLLGLAMPARAAERNEGDLAVSGSIASPGSTTAVFTNPAGLVAGLGARLSLQAGSPDPMKDPNYRALALAGGGIFGAAAGVDYSMPDSGGDSAWGVYGLGLNLEPLGVSVGLAGKTGIKKAKDTDFTAGVLIRPTPFVTIGGTAKNLKDGVDSYGVGISFELMSGVALVADSAFNDHFKNGEAKPGLKLSNSFAGLAVSYGTGDTDQFSKDFSAGAYLQVGTNSELEVQYNHGGSIPKYYAALSFGF